MQKQSTKKSAQSRTNKKSSDLSVNNKPEHRDLPEGGLTASLGEMANHPVNEGIDTPHLKLSADSEGSSSASGEESNPSWKDTFFMVGGAVLVAALLEGARRLTGKTIGSDENSDSAEKSTADSGPSSRTGSGKSSFSGVSTKGVEGPGAFEGSTVSSPSKSPKADSAEPGKRIAKNKTALKTKSGYPTQVGGKGKKKPAAARTGAKSTGKKSSSSGRRATRDY